MGGLFMKVGGVDKIVLCGGGGIILGGGLGGCVMLGFSGGRGIGCCSRGLGFFVKVCVIILGGNFGGGLGGIMLGSFGGGFGGLLGGGLGGNIFGGGVLIWKLGWIGRFLGCWFLGRGSCLGGGFGGGFGGCGCFVCIEFFLVWFFCLLFFCCVEKKIDYFRRIEIKELY